MPSKYFERALVASSKESKTFISKTIDIVEQIYEILDSKGFTQKRLAELLEKEESEISKWLSGTHNLTIKTLSKIEYVLGEDIIQTPKRFKGNLIKHNFENLSKYTLSATKKKRFSARPGFTTCSDVKIVYNKHWIGGKSNINSQIDSMAS